MVKKIFSGVQPTGNLHLGNYLGAIRSWVEMQSHYDCYFAAVDLHALTVTQDPKELYEGTLEGVAYYLACGLDPQKMTLFIQSHVAAHAELGWILTCSSYMGELSRMTQYKDKTQKQAHIGVGLFTYPALMAADILLYKATHVPVGADQKQHLELSRDIAQKFNNDFNCKDFFPLPEPLIPKNVSRVMSLRDGNKKMSKSDESDYSRINLKDSKDEIFKKIKKAKTDTKPIPASKKELINRPEANNLINIYAEMTDKKFENVLDEMSGKEFSFFKKELSEVIIDKICPIGKKVKDLMGDKTYLESILKKGKEKANIIAEENLKKVREIIGFV